MRRGGDSRSNPKLKALELDKSRTPIPEIEMSNKLEHFVEHIKKDVVPRFHCTRVQTRPVCSKQACRGSLGPSGGAAGLLRVPVDRAGLPSRTAWAGSSRAEDPRDDPLLSHRINKRNMCYMSSAAQALQWIQLLSGQGLQAMGTGADFFRALSCVRWI